MRHRSFIPGGLDDSNNGVRDEWGTWAYFDEDGCLVVDSPSDNWALIFECTDEQWERLCELRKNDRTGDRPGDPNPGAGDPTTADPSKSA